MKLIKLNEMVENTIKQYRKAKARTLVKARKERWGEFHINSIKNEIERGSPFPLKYRKTMGSFVNYKGSCAIDLVNETGHSYRWWSMFERINGKLVLNTYRYSSMTSKHISKAARTLDTLGISYLRVEAPEGLQDLVAARKHAAYQKAKADLEYAHARVKVKYATNHAKELIKNLAKIGVKVTKRDLSEAMDLAVKIRESRLERQRMMRLKVVDNATEADRDKAGFHALRGKDEYISIGLMNSLKNDARKNGHKTLYIHRVEGLEVVLQVVGI